MRRVCLLSAAVLFVSLTATAARGQQAQLLDDFNRANSNTVGGGWTEVETGGSPDRAAVAANNLKLSTGAVGIDGREYVYQDVSARYVTTLNASAAVKTWLFNMRQSRGGANDPSGFNNSRYGVAFVLGSTSNDFKAGDGYAVVLGQSGTIDALRLVKFTGGLDSDANLINIISGGDYDNAFMAVKVTYDPAGDKWNLFVATSATGFPDPQTASYAPIGSSDVIDSTHTGRSLKYLGCFWNHAAATAESALFDNIYTPATTTLAELSSFTAQATDVGVLLEWQTGFELDNLGFNLYREEPGVRMRLNPSLIAGSALLAGESNPLTAGNSYTWLNAARSASVTARYWLEDVDLDGSQRWYGPIEPLKRQEPRQAKATPVRAPLLSEVGTSAVPANATSAAKMAGEASPVAQSLPERRSGQQSWPGASIQQVVVGSEKWRDASARQRWLAARGDALKILVRKPGWYRVGWSELVAAGLSLSTDARRLQLYADGHAVPLRVSCDAEGRMREQDAIEFYGVGLDTQSTDARVYWLIEESENEGRRRDIVPLPVPIFIGREEHGDMSVAPSVPIEELADREALTGETMEAHSAAGIVAEDEGMLGPPGVAVLEQPLETSMQRGFDFTVEERERKVYFASALNGEAENFFGHTVTSTPVTQSLRVQNLDQENSEPASLEVALQGLTNRRHEVRVLLNGAQVGTLIWEGNTHVARQLSVPANLLLSDGENVVSLSSAGGALDVSLLDYLRLTYRHLYRADNNSLRFSIPAHGQRCGAELRISGFTRRDVRVLDTTDSDAAHEMKISVVAEGDGYAVILNPRACSDTTEQWFWAFTSQDVERPAMVARNQPSAWHQFAGAEMLLFAPRDFHRSIGPLVALRRSEGLSVAVVDVEDIFDERSFGAREPRALKDFLAWAMRWPTPPRFVLLVGDGSFDPRDRLGRGARDLVSTKLVDTALTETASDDWFADFDDDGLPELAVGRLPVSTPEEADAVISKIVRDESRTNGGTRSLLLVSDKKGADGFDFETMTDALRLTLPSSLPVEVINRREAEAGDLRGHLLGSLNAGPLVVNYFGHGSVDVWSGAQMLKSGDARSLANDSGLSLFVMMTCLNGYFQDIFRESLGEALLKAPQGGALAVWASTGLTAPSQQSTVNQELLRLLLGDGRLTIGEAVRKAKAATADRDVRRTWVLLGDPASKLR